MSKREILTFHQNALDQIFGRIPPKKAKAKAKVKAPKKTPKKAKAPSKASNKTKAPKKVKQSTTYDAEPLLRIGFMKKKIDELKQEKV